MQRLSVTGFLCLALLVAVSSGNEVGAGTGFAGFGKNRAIALPRARSKLVSQKRVRKLRRIRRIGRYSRRARSFGFQKRGRRLGSGLLPRTPNWSARRSLTATRFGQRSRLWRSRFRSGKFHRRRWRSRFQASRTIRSSRWSRKTFF